MAVKRDLWHLWRAGLALVVAISLVALIASRSATFRLSNLALSTDFGETYLMFSKSEPGKGYVVNRRDSTVRRSDKKQSGRKWDISRITSEEDTDTWLVRAKRKGTVFLVPLADVKDWTYPFLYQFVRKHREELDLPKVEWTQFFINRVYQGLYLKIHLPFDLRKKDGGSGVLRELLTIKGSRLSYINTRFSDARGPYVASVAGGFFPELTPPPPALAWLSERCPTSASTLLMSNRPPYALSLLPLPISLPDLFKAKNGRPPASFEDDRIRHLGAEARQSNPDLFPFSKMELAALKTEFDQYAASIRMALRIDGELHQTVTKFATEIPRRQAAVADLQLSLDRL